MKTKKTIKKNLFFCLQFFLCSALLPTSLKPYSSLRPYNGSPIIATNWVNKTRIHYLQDSHLEIFPLFKTFDHDYFYDHMLPNTPIPFRYFPNKTIDPKVLKTAINQFFQEIRLGCKKKFSEFTILKNESFNSRKQAGLIVVKGKKWPLNQFVVKLFMETPQSFIQPSNKGFIAICHFIAGHGCTRYMLGFTRLKNLEMLKKMIADSPYWSKLIDFPRKWFWIPDDYPWIHLTGYHISGYEKIAIDIPGAYAIVADAIDVEREFSIKEKEDRDLGVAICNYLECLMDPHSNNFVLEHKTKKVVIIDTEHSPTMVAMKEPIHIESYSQWYSFLVKKGLHEYFGRTNKERKELHLSHIPPYEGPEKYRTKPTSKTIMIPSEESVPKKYKENPLTSQKKTTSQKEKEREEEQKKIKEQELLAQNFTFNLFDNRS